MITPYQTSRPSSATAFATAKHAVNILSTYPMKKKNIVSTSDGKGKPLKSLRHLLHHSKKIEPVCACGAYKLSPASSQSKGIIGAPIGAFTAIKHFGPLDRSFGGISAVHPILLFTMPSFSVPIFLPGKTMTVGRIVMGATGQRGNRLPLALTHHCPLVFTVDDKQHFFTAGRCKRPPPLSGPLCQPKGSSLHRSTPKTVPARCPLASTVSSSSQSPCETKRRPTEP
jgi:hypothetical protein